jgi:pimeloyl-ACP methyl ester carboxylesterase
MTTVTPEQAMRQDVQFPSGDGACAAWLYRPAGAGPYPIVVMGHGLSAVKEMRLDAYAERFRAAGYACLVFDYRHFGASSGEPRQLLDIKRQLEDWSSAVDFARSRRDVDPSRVVIWGTSFGGGHVLVTASRRSDIAAAIAQCPFTDGRSGASHVEPRVVIKLVTLAVLDGIGARFGRAPIRVPAAGPAGTAALMTAPDALPGMRAMADAEGAPWRNEVCARVALPITRHVPGRRARHIPCPVLFAVCEKDSVASAKAAVRHAQRAPQGEIRLYDEGHFDIYMGEAFERVVSDQLAFLVKHVPVGNAPTAARTRPR